MAKPTRAERKFLDAGFFLDRDVTIRAAKRTMVNVRAEHPCAVGPLVGRDDCELRPGDRAMTETAIVDGEFGQWWACIDCMKAVLADKLWDADRQKWVRP